MPIIKGSYSRVGMDMAAVGSGHSRTGYAAVLVAMTIIQGSNTLVFVNVAVIMGNGRPGITFKTVVMHFDKVCRCSIPVIVVHLEDLLL